MLYKDSWVTLQNITQLINESKEDCTNTFDYLLSFRPESEDTLLTNLIYLKENKLISYTDSSPVIEDIRLTPLGKAYPQIRKHERKNNFINSVIFPCIVAFITTLLTLLLNNYI